MPVQELARSRRDGTSRVSRAPNVCQCISTQKIKTRLVQSAARDLGMRLCRFIDGGTEAPRGKCTCPRSTDWKSVLRSHPLAPEFITSTTAVITPTAQVPSVFYLLSGAVRSERPGTRWEGSVRRESNASLPSPISIFSGSVLAASVSSPSSSVK